MTVRYLQDGISSIHTGDPLLAMAPFFVGCDIYYVASDGDDLNDGLDRERPLATLERAVALIAATGMEHPASIILLCDGYNHDSSTTVEFAQNDIVVLGEGSTGGVPHVSLSANGTSDVGYLVSGNRVHFRNIRFPARTAEGSANPVIRVTGYGPVFKNCLFEAGANDVYNLNLDMTAAESGDRVVATLEDCTIRSTGTSKSARPDWGVFAGNTEGGTTYEVCLNMTRCTFDNGVAGFDEYSLEMGGNGTVRAESISLLRGADIALSYMTGAAGVGAGYVHIEQSTGGGTVVVEA